MLVAKVGKSKHEVLSLAGELGIEVGITTNSQGDLRYHIAGKKHTTGMDAYRALEKLSSTKTVKTPRVPRGHGYTPPVGMEVLPKRISKTKPRRKAKVTTPQRTVAELEKLALARRSEAYRDVARVLQDTNEQYALKDLELLATKAGVQLTYEGGTYAITDAGRTHTRQSIQAAYHTLSTILRRKRRALYTP
jgi:hypothetical protein